MIPVKDDSYIFKPFEEFDNGLIYRLVPIREELKAISDQSIVEDKGEQEAENRTCAVTIERIISITLANVCNRIMNIKGKSFEGSRANPRGITYLYLANNKDTACAKVRPWKGAFISLAGFKVKRELKMVDCTKDIKERNGFPFYLDEPASGVREQCVWADINKAFSKPVNPNDPETEYVPTQIIAEVFKKEGYDGIGYRSSLVEKSLNVVLFDLGNVEMISCWLTRTKGIQVEFEHIKKRLFIQGSQEMTMDWSDISPVFWPADILRAWRDIWSDQLLF